MADYCYIRLLIIWILILYLFGNTSGEVTCYSCQESAPDKVCRESPWDFPNNLVMCMGKCYTKRLERKAIAGDVFSFGRGCDTGLPYPNQCYEDSLFRTCTTLCSGDYCNTGNGIPAGGLLSIVSVIVTQEMTTVKTGRPKPTFTRRPFTKLPVFRPLKRNTSHMNVSNLWFSIILSTFLLTRWHYSL